MSNTETGRALPAIQATSHEAFLDSAGREEFFHRTRLKQLQNLADNTNQILDLFARLAIDANGWFSDVQGFSRINFDGDSMLVVTELAEMVEADRTNAMSDKIPEFHGRDEEIADVLVRIFHMIGKYNLNAGPAFIAKMEYNLNRPFKHGKKY